MVVKDSLKKENSIFKTFLYAFKNKELESWWFEFKNGHPFLLDEEADIIIKTRLNDKLSLWMNDSQIKKLIKTRIKAMYENKFPNAKKWSFPISDFD